MSKPVRRRITTTSIPEGTSDNDLGVLHQHPVDAQDEVDQSKGSAQAASSSKSPSNAISQATKTLRTAAVFFFVGFIWHSTILPFFYKQVGPEIAALIQLSGSHVDAFKDPPNIDPKVLREFGLAGAATHTIVFMFGFICATALRTVRFSSIVRSQGGRLEPIGIGVSLVLVVWTAAVFHVLAQAFCRYAFETKFGPVYSYALLFYEETNGKTPFAWASSVSFTTALLLGFLISTDFHMTRFEKVVMFPFQKSGGFMGNPLSVVVPFAIWVGLLDSVLIPFSERFFSNALVGIGIGPDEVVTGSHAFAFAVGLMMMFAGTARDIMQDSRCCGVCLDATGIKSKQQPPKTEPSSAEESLTTQTLDYSNILHVVQATAMTLGLSSTLLASALFKGEVAIETVFRTLWRPALLAMAFGMAWIGIVRFTPSPSQLVDFIIDRRYPRRRTVFTYMLLLSLWNCHLFPFFGCWIPFHVFAAVNPFDGYDQKDALWDGFLYVFTGPYAGPVLIQGVIKAVTARFKAQWGLVQESLLAILILLPPSFTLWFRWREGHVALPLYFVMSALELVYLLTWRNRPEYSGWRNWPELKSSRLWTLIEDYFSVRIIVKTTKGVIVDSNKLGAEDASIMNGDAIPGFEPHKPRIIGFHPHGLFPCTVVWMHLIPLWKRVFGSRLFPHALTDAFTHVPPGMREVMQWAGGREITKGVMNAMLSDGDTLIVVPGGQSELLYHTYENTRDRKVVLCAKHRGFIRVAMENRADLVPMISFGELLAIKNIEVPRLQLLTRKTIGFPIPFLPVGIAGVLPLPKRIPFTLVYGEPITYFSSDFPADKEFTEDDVEQVYQIYFQRVRDLFEEFKAQSGFENWELVLSGFDSEGTNPKSKKRN